MNPDHWQLVEGVLDRALASDPSDWPALLDDTCRADPELRNEVEALLALRHAARFLQSPPSAAAAAAAGEHSIAVVLASIVRRYEEQGRQAEAAKYRALLEPPRP